MKETHVKNETFEQKQNNINKIAQIYDNAQNFCS